ncbi:MAG: flippase-like domain-containing protein [bacterium]|nr:flippase-like domain-containing protein [bacterium]
MKKKYVALAIRLVISIGLIAYFVFTLAQKSGGLHRAFEQLLNTFAAAPLIWLLPAGLLPVVGFALTSLRWKILLAGQDVHTSYTRLFTYYFMAAFFNNFLPSTIGGDTLRVIESRKLTGNTTTSVMVVIVERLTGLMALVLIAAAALTTAMFRRAEQDVGAWLLLGVTLAVFFLVIVLAHPRVAPRILKLTGKILPLKIQSFLEQAYGAVEVYYKRPGALLMAQAVSIVYQLNIVIYYFLIARALHQEPDLIEFMIKMPVVVFLLMVVPAVNGIGVRTAGFKGLMGFRPVHALAVESIDLGFRMFYGLLGGLVFLFHRRSQD